jgi:hypothetical protein
MLTRLMLQDFGTECRDVRTREVGIQEIHHKVGQFNSCIFLTHHYSTVLFTVALECDQP